MNLKLIVIITMLFVVSLHEGTSQTISIIKGHRINYLALDINISTNLNEFEMKKIRESIERLVEEHNKQNPKYYMYLVDNLEEGMTGVKMTIDHIHIPNKKEQNTAFILSMIGIVLTPVAFIASGADFFIIFWVTTHNKIDQTTFLTPDIYRNYKKPIKISYRTNGGWFKSIEENENSILKKFEDRFDQMLTRIHNTYHPPKEFRNSPPVDYDLPVTFMNMSEFDYYTIDEDSGKSIQALPMDSPGVLGEIEVGDSLAISRNDTVKFDSALIQISESQRNSDSDFIRWWTYDIACGMSIPVTSDNRNSFPPAFSLRSGPKWYVGENFRFKPYFGLDWMYKVNRNDLRVSENWLNYKFGLEIERPFFPSDRSNFSYYPIVFLSYNFGNYNYERLAENTVDQGEFLQLNHEGINAGLGIGCAFNWFTMSIYYSYYKPTFKYVEGNDFSETDFNRPMNMSTIDIHLGISIW